MPGDTTPTWELEMLVSGAVLVGLFQVQPVLTGLWQGVLPRLATSFGTMLVGLGYAYLKAMVYALTAAFVVHLVSRAYWVALVGLDSVFPGGVRWDRIRSYGPVAREVVRKRIQPLPTLVSRLDNFCSIVFAVGFAAVWLAVASFGLLAIAGVIAWAVSSLFLGGQNLDRVFLVAFGVLSLPGLVVALDRRFGAGRPAGGRYAAFVRLATRTAYSSLGMRVYGPLLLTLRSNLPPRRLRLALMALFMGSYILAFTQMMQSRGKLEVGPYGDLPASLGGDATSYLHYADQRVGAGLQAPTPFIQSDVVADPYVRLFIPFVPRVDGVELAACRERGGPATPAATTPAPGGSAGPRVAVGPGADRAGASETDADDAGIAIRCLEAIHAVTLNGAAVPSTDARYATDPASGLQGLMEYIPVAGLPRGRNVLTVRLPPPPDEPGAAPPSPVSIAFWL